MDRAEPLLYGWPGSGCSSMQCMGPKGRQQNRI